MLKVLITGASGFVGQNVKEYLGQKECVVLAPTSRELNCIEENDVKSFLEKEQVNIVLHFAVYGDGIDKSKDGSKILEYNLRMFLNFSKYSYLYDRMIYTGSGAEYDKRYPIKNISEEKFGNSIPIDQYGLMKYTVSQIIEQSDNIYNLRLFGIFGKYEYWQSKFISNICCKAIKELPLTIRQNCKFDYIFIDEFSRMLWEFIQLEHPKYHCYNATSGQVIELQELARMVNRISGKQLPIYICKEGYANEYTASNARIMNELKSFEISGMENNVKELYQWYQEHESEIDMYSLIYG